LPELFRVDDILRQEKPVGIQQVPACNPLQFFIRKEEPGIYLPVQVRKNDFPENEFPRLEHLQVGTVRFDKKEDFLIIEDPDEQDGDEVSDGAFKIEP
jgi:hypothetical protein